MPVNQLIFDPEAVAPGRQETNSPVFASLIGQMGKEASRAILDLGPARAANLELLSAFRCKLFFEDAHELIGGLTGDTEADEARLKGWLDQWTVGKGDETIDVVLAWDVFNYLEPSLWKIFLGHLSPLLRCGAYVYLIVYSQREMPTLPMQFKAVAPDKMEFQASSGETRAAPRFNQTELMRRLPHFSVAKSVLLRNGLQEYLLKYKG